MKKPRRPSKKKVLKGPWMSILASMAAVSRADGGEGLKALVQHAKFDVRPHLSITKHAA